MLARGQRQREGSISQKESVMANHDDDWRGIAQRHILSNYDKIADMEARTDKITNIGFAVFAVFFGGLIGVLAILPFVFILQAIVGTPDDLICLLDARGC